MVTKVTKVEMTEGGIAATEDDVVAALTADLSSTAAVLFAAGGVSETLAQVLSLALSTVDGCSSAGIFLLVDGAIVSVAHTHPVVLDLHQVQQRHDEGPCLDAARTRHRSHSDDLAVEDRWPLFAPAAVGLGVHSAMALPLVAKDTVGALNIYGSAQGSFSVVDRARAQLLAAFAAQALSTARGHEREDRLADNLHAAMQTREVIGQAQGILMERDRLTADQAFDVLRRASQHLNTKLREVAQHLVETGERPSTGRADTS